MPPQRAPERGPQVVQRAVELLADAVARVDGQLLSAENAIEMPNSRWITPSWISRARSIRSCSWRASSWLRVAIRASAASAATLPIVHSR